MCIAYVVDIHNCYSSAAMVRLVIMEYRKSKPQFVYSRIFKGLILLSIMLESQYSKEHNILLLILLQKNVIFGNMMEISRCLKARYPYCEKNTHPPTSEVMLGQFKLGSFCWLFTRISVTIYDIYYNNNYWRSSA